MARGNHTGKGGFGEHPENRSNGRWSKDTSISYWQNKLIRMSVADFKAWVKNTPDDVRTMAMEIAYQSVLKSRTDLNYQKEVADRTEGKAVAFTDVTTGGEKIQPLTLKQFYGETEEEVE